MRVAQMKPRSPVLGYNHNVRYAGRMWHVQTEDSGVQNPHLFTHLFHDGTILASKKLDYDATSEVSSVQKLMQAQHKLMLRDLKSGAFDAKIEQYFGPIVRDPGDAEPADAKPADLKIEVEPQPPEPITEPSIPQSPVPVAAAAKPREDHPTLPDLAPMMPPPAAAGPRTAPPAPRPRSSTLAPARPAVAVNAARTGSALPPPTIGMRTPAPPVGATPARPPAPTIGGSRSGSPQGNRPTAEGVIVARPTVIVGQGGAKKGDAADFWKTERRAPDPAFGADLISEKSLDEVILAYLSEDAPKK